MSKTAAQLADYYSIDDVLQRLNHGMTKDALKDLARRGGFVPWTRVGARWFFKKSYVDRYLEDHEHTAEESERSFKELAAMARDTALRGKRGR